MPAAIGLLLLAAIGEEALAATVIIGSLTVAEAVGTAVVLAGTIGLNALLNHQAAQQPGTSALPPPDNGNQPLLQAIPPRTVGYGHLVRIAGSYVCFEVDTSGNSWDVLAVHHGLIEAIRGYYLDDDPVVITSPPVVDDQGDGRYSAGSVRIETRLGLATETAYSDVTSALGTSIWDSSHRGDGLASLMLFCTGGLNPQTFTTRFPRQLPSPSIVADLSPIFDARDPGQVLGTPSTWLCSSNPAVQLMDYLTNVDRGMGLDYATLVAPVLGALMAEADICDEAVALADGTTEPRYLSRGTWTLDADHADVVSTIMDTCDGWISENGDGSIAFRAGKFRNPSVTLTSDDITGFSLQKGVGDENVVNELDTTYTEPGADYKTVAGQPWRDEDDISARGKVLSQPLALPWVQSHPQTRRLAKRKMAKLDAFMRGTIETRLSGLAALGERWINVNATDSAPADLADLTIENGGCTIDLANGRLTFKFVSVDPDTIDVWDSATEEGSPPNIPAKIVVPPPPVLTSVVASETSTSEGIEIFLAFDDPHRADIVYQAQYRVHGTSSWTLAPRDNGTISGATVTIVAVPNGVILSTGQVYDLQVSSFAVGGGVRSAWSPVSPIVWTT